MYCTVVVENDYQVYNSLRVFHTPCGSEPVPECQHDSSDTSHRAIISTSPRYHDGGAPIDGCQMVRGVHLVVAEFNSRATAATAATPREPRVCLRTASGEWGYARCASGSG